MKEDVDYAQLIIGSKVKYINLYTRNCFYSGIMVSIMKCAVKFNQYRVRNK